MSCLTFEWILPIIIETLLSQFSAFLIIILRCIPIRLMCTTSSWDNQPYLGIDSILYISLFNLHSNTLLFKYCDNKEETRSQAVTGLVALLCRVFRFVSWQKFHLKILLIELLGAAHYLMRWDVVLEPYSYSGNQFKMKDVLKLTSDQFNSKNMASMYYHNWTEFRFAAKHFVPFSLQMVFIASKSP